MASTVRAAGVSVSEMVRYAIQVALGIGLALALAIVVLAGGAVRLPRNRIPQNPLIEDILKINNIKLIRRDDRLGRRQPGGEASAAPESGEERAELRRLGHRLPGRRMPHHDRAPRHRSVRSGRRDQRPAAEEQHPVRDRPGARPDQGREDHRHLRSCRRSWIPARRSRSPGASTSSRSRTIRPASARRCGRTTTRIGRC